MRGGPRSGPGRQVRPARSVWASATPRADAVSIGRGKHNTGKRVVLRLHAQLTLGCGSPTCKNVECASSQIGKPGSGVGVPPMTDVEAFLRALRLAKVCAVSALWRRAAEAKRALSQRTCRAHPSARPRPSRMPDRQRLLAAARRLRPAPPGGFPRAPRAPSRRARPQSTLDQVWALYCDLHDDDRGTRCGREAGTCPLTQRADVAVADWRLGSPWKDVRTCARVALTLRLLSAFRTASSRFHGLPCVRRLRAGTIQASRWAMRRWWRPYRRR
jgi:hypothetical protein